MTPLPSSKMRSLLVAPIYTTSLATGGGQRTFHLCRSLARLGDVDLLLVSETVWKDEATRLDAIRLSFPDAREVFSEQSVDQYLTSPPVSGSRASKLLYFGARIHHGLRSRERFYRPTPHAAVAMRERIEARRYDVIVGRYLQCTALSGALAQDLIPVIVDLDDLDEMTLLSRIESPTTSSSKRLMLRHQLRQVRTLARRLRAKCSHVFTASEVDLKFVNHRSSSVLPNIPLRPEAPIKTAVADILQRPVVLFVGTYSHRANREGILHFVDRCWPRIRAARPDAQLRIVGSGGWESVKDEIRRAGVDVIGHVSNLASEYAAATVCVVPVFEGSGTKIKVLEALMHRRAVATLTHSARGYDELIGNGISVGNDDIELAIVCLDLLNNPEASNMAGTKGAKIVEIRYSFETVALVVKQALDSCGVYHGL